jgi:signal transduction histidine kinase
MTAGLDRRILDAILPFSFLTDIEGHLSLVGSSLSKVHPNIRIGDHFGDAFVIEQPRLGVAHQAPRELVGELVVLVSRGDTGIKLRGQVVPLDPDRGTALFSLTPVVTEISQLSSAGLQFADFPVGDPIFDYLLFIQAQRIARGKLEQANAKIAWDFKVSKLLHELTVRTYDLDDAGKAYAEVVQGVCQALSWNIGHVYVTSGGKTPVLRSAEAWFISDHARYGEFRARTEGMVFAAGKGLPGRAWNAARPVWSADVKQDPDFHRKDTLPESATVVGVAVPVIVEGVVAAVLEFFTEKPPINREDLERVFELVGILLASVVTRQRIATREKQQLGALVSASKMAALGEIAAGIAHEIRNPLSSISLTTHLIETLSKTGGLDAEAVKTNTFRIKACVQRIATIVSELRDFSRDSSSDPFSPTPLNKIVDETLDLCSARFGSKGIKLDLGEFPHDWIVECRASQISQVLLNLLNNAHDAVASLDLRWVRLEGRELGETIEISVTDSGASIESDIVEKMMVPFFTTKPPGMGTGLGLSISSNIMTDHGGELRFDAGSPNTRFVVVVPKKRGERAPHASGGTATAV